MIITAGTIAGTTVLVYAACAGRGIARLYCGARRKAGPQSARDSHRIPAAPHAQIERISPRGAAADAAPSVICDDGLVRTTDIACGLRISVHRHARSDIPRWRFAGMIEVRRSDTVD
jgi:hypothetical protein